MTTPFLPRVASVLLRAVFLSLAVVLAAARPVQGAGSIEWRGLLFEYIGQDEYVFPWDGRSPKLVVRVTNQAASTSPIFEFRVAAEGLGNYPDALDGGGFATFPNGGAVQLAPGESTVVGCWSAGVYEDRFNNIPPSVGESKDYNFDFLFTERTTDPMAPADSTKLSQIVRFTNQGQNPPLTGPLQVSGTIHLEGPASPAGVLVEVCTQQFSWTMVGQASFDGTAYTVAANLPDRTDWHVRASADGYTSQVVAVGDGSTPFELTLRRRSQPPVNYELLTTVSTNTGFWKGAVSESEGTFVCFPGQENWNRGSSDAEARAVVEASRVYTFDGTLVWEHNPGWEMWGGDMTPDGRYVAYVLNPTFLPFYSPPQFKVVLLDGLTGSVIWEKGGPAQDPAWKIFEGLELAISPDGQWIAVGTTANGRVTLLDRATGDIVWTVPGPGALDFGQVRKLKFSADSQSLFCGSGDMYLRQLRVSDGAVLWRTHVGGWPFVNGLTLSPDGQYLSVGTKSFDASVVRASDGERLWMVESGDLDLVFSPDGEHVVTFGGRIYDALTGRLVGHAGIGATSQFTPDGEYVIKLDRNVTVHDLGGRMVAAFEASGIGPNGGEQSQWSYVTRDGRYIIILGRDMANPPQVGIAIYERNVGPGVLPAVVTEPSDRTVAEGESVVLNVTASGEGPLSYQWYHDGAFLVGATGPQLFVSGLDPADAGDYTVVVTNAVGAAGSAAATLTLLPESAASRINNFSIRCFAGTGSDTLIVGLVTGGAGTTGQQPLLVRGIGPTLDGLGVEGAMLDPYIEVYQGTGVIDSNDDWAGDAAVVAVADRVSAFAIDPGTADAALQIPDVNPNSYTVHVRGNGDTTGVALAEIYDATETAALSTTAPRLVNVSARALVGSGDDILIPGFVITGSSPKTVLIRAVGPTLGDLGVEGAMVDPRLQLYAGSTEIDANDNWGDDPAAVAPLTALFERVGAFALPAGSADAVLVVTLDPGLYTAHVRGVDGGTGVALVEVYEVAD